MRTPGAGCHTWTAGRARRAARPFGGQRRAPRGRRRRLAGRPALGCGGVLARQPGVLREHDAARLFVHVGLETVSVLEGHRALRRRASADLVDQSLEVGEARGGVFAQHELAEARPAPHIHVDDGVAVPQHVALFGQAGIENTVVALDFEAVAVGGIGQLLGSEVPEVHGLAREGPDPGGDEHQPGQQFATRLWRIARQKLTGLFGEIEQDRVAVEYGDVAIDDGWYLAVRIDGEEGGLELVAFARVDRDRLVGETRLLEEQG